MHRYQSDLDECCRFVHKWMPQSWKMKRCTVAILNGKNSSTCWNWKVISQNCYFDHAPGVRIIKTSLGTFPHDDFNLSHQTTLRMTSRSRRWRASCHRGEYTNQRSRGKRLLCVWKSISQAHVAISRSYWSRESAGFGKSKSCHFPLWQRRTGFFKKYFAEAYRFEVGNPLAPYCLGLGSFRFFSSLFRTSYITKI